MDKYAETKQILNDMASVKMAMNSHKGSIENQKPQKIMEMLADEVNELDQAIENGNLMDVFEEAADVQNFLLAIVHQRVQEYRSRK